MPTNQGVNKEKRGLLAAGCLAGVISGSLITTILHLTNHLTDSLGIFSATTLGSMTDSEKSITNGVVIEAGCGLLGPVLFTCFSAYVNTTERDEATSDVENQANTSLSAEPDYLTKKT